jgi:hypothetical protein
MLQVPGGRLSELYSAKVRYSFIANLGQNCF